MTARPGSLHDPGFAVVDHYYERGLHWEEHQEQERRNRELGWELELEPVRARIDGPSGVLVQLRDSAGGPLAGARIHLSVLPIAHAAEHLEADCEELAPGRYRARLRLRHRGLHEWRFTVRRGGDTFTAVRRAVLSFSVSGSR